MRTMIKVHLHVLFGLFVLMFLFTVNPIQAHAENISTAEATMEWKTVDGRKWIEFTVSDLDAKDEYKDGDYKHYIFETGSSKAVMKMYKNGEKKYEFVGNFEEGTNTYPKWEYSVSAAPDNPSSIDLDDYTAKVTIYYASTESCSFSYSSTKDPTCTSKGYDIYKCSVCKGKRKKNYTAALGHKYTDDSDVKWSDQTYKCKNRSTATVSFKCVACGDWSDADDATVTDETTITTAQTCTSKEKLTVEFTAKIGTRNDKTYKTTKTYEDKTCSAHSSGKGHNYTTATFTPTLYSCQGSTASATFKCSDCEVTKSADSVSGNTTTATAWSCTSAHKINVTYTAIIANPRTGTNSTVTSSTYSNQTCAGSSSITVDGTTVNKSHSAAKGHNYATTSTVTWGTATYKCGNNSSRTATFKCTDCSQTASASVSDATTVTQIQSCTKDEQMTVKFMAKISNPRINNATTTVTKTDTKAVCQNHKAKGHDWRWIIDQDLTCTTDYIGHQYCFQTTDSTSYNGSSTYNGKTLKGQECHNINGSNTDGSAKSLSKTVLESAPGHHFEELVVDTYATCTTEGKAHYQCTNTINGARCTATNSTSCTSKTANGGTYTIAAKGHYITSDDITTVPSVYEDGVRKYKCEWCNEYVAESEISKRQFNIYIGDNRVTEIRLGDDLVWNGSVGDTDSDGGHTTCDDIFTIVENNWYYKNSIYGD